MPSTPALAAQVQVSVPSVDEGFGLKTINATLTASQKTPTGRGYATASLADNGRLHPTQTVTSTFTGGKTIGAECGTFYVRLRYKTAGSGTLEFQKITDPTVAGQWTTWTSLVATNVFSDNSVGIFWTGTYVVAVWLDTASTDVKYKRSSDGLAWSATGTVRAALVLDCANAGVSAGSTSSGVMQGYNTALWWLAYNDSTNAWAAAENSGAVFTTQTPFTAALRDVANSRYVVYVSVTGYVTWAIYAVVAYTRATGSATWSTGQIVFSGNGLAGTFQGLNVSQSKIGGYWWLSFYRFRLWNTLAISNFYITASNDGLFFDDPLPTDVGGNQLVLSILPAPSGGTWANAYWSTEAAIWRLDSYSYFTGATVVAHHLLTAHSGHQEGGGANGRGGASPTQPSTIGQITALIDNRAVNLATPKLFSVFTLTRGLVVNGVSYGQSAGTWYVTAFRFVSSDQILEIVATDASGLLSSWFADTAYTYRGATVKFLVERICALAGVHTVTFDATASWTNTVPSFTHPVGENAVSSLKSLGQRVPFEYVPQEDGSLYFYVPAASPATVYTYGVNGTDHAAWLSGAPAVGSGSTALGPIQAPPWFGQLESVTYLQDIGSPPRNRVVEGIDQTQLYITGRRRSLVINDRRITTDAANVAAAAALLVAAEERKRAGLFEAPPSFSLEPGDVVAISGGSAYAAANGPWRVEHIEEFFNKSGRVAFAQRITVRGTA